MNPVLLVTLCVLGAVLAAVRADALMPKDWPDQFSISFNCNITTEVAKPVVSIVSKMWYDWTIQVSTH